MRAIGFSPRLHHELVERTTFWQQYQQLLSTSLAGVLLIAGLIVEYSGSQHEISKAFFVASILCGGWKIAIKGFNAARQLSLDMNTLMMIAVVAAGAIGKFEEGAAVVVLFAISNLLERYSMEQSRKKIRSLLTVGPTTVRVYRDGRETTVDVEHVSLGERIIIRPGERIPLDEKLSREIPL